MSYTRRTLLKLPLAILANSCNTVPTLQEGVIPSRATEKKISSIFRGIPLTDQHGKPFQPSELFKEGPCLILFGYGGCPMCTNISVTVAAIQQELLSQGKKVPIVTISVQPETDRNNMRYYIGSYYVMKVKQFPTETLSADNAMRRQQGEQSFQAAQQRPQGDRILHVVNPPSAKDAQELERRMGLIINPNNPIEHSSFISYCDKGELVGHFRGLPPPHSMQNIELFAQDMAKVVAAQIASPQRSR